jgi:outer membrane protein insertion porin family
VAVEGVTLSARKIRALIPVYEEGAVDEDLLSEGARTLRDYYQRQGYFDVTVTHSMATLDTGHAKATFQVNRGPIHRVDAVELVGNKYFNSNTLQEHLSVHKADLFSRHGLFSQSLVSADIASITAVYQMNGFSRIKVTPIVDDTDARSTNPKALAHLSVKYKIEEGSQQKVGRFDIQGTSRVSVDQLRPLLNTQPGQPYSPQNVEGDRDAIRAYYLSQGFERMQLQVIQQDDPANSSLVDITMKATEGDQIFVNKVLISGLHYTRPAIVDRKVQIHAGDALDESAVLETQRSLYDLALFNEVDTAVQNPTGEELRKNVLLQLTEARRWDINYGFGFEAQTGTPSTNCTVPGCTPEGKAGVSPRVQFDLSRINLRGRDQSLSIRTTYGSLEKRATAIYETPHLFNHPNFNVSISGGYNSSQDITTYAASWLEASFRVTQRFLAPNSRFSRANTLIYSMTYRRVVVDPNSLKVAPETIPLLSQPVRVGGPGMTWIRDTRDKPLDAHRGTYNSLQEFFAASYFGSQADFNRIDFTNSSYYQYGKRHWVLARSMRYGFELPFGSPDFETIPLPERLYAGGATSHRGFAINAAGPRDLQTGFPIGGQSAFVNTLELRTPSPTLPYVGNSLSFVLFHDMGNSFEKPSQLWPSFFRVQQPNQEDCKSLATTTTTPASDQCSFAYFSHAIGMGLRYNTPIGPLRADFSYNLNPPIYPVTFSNTVPNFHPYVGQAPHFNFFFSIGQSF